MKIGITLAKTLELAELEKPGSAVMDFGSTGGYASTARKNFDAAVHRFKADVEASRGPVEGIEMADESFEKVGEAFQALVAEGIYEELAEQEIHPKYRQIAFAQFESRLIELCIREYPEFVVA